MLTLSHLNCQLRKIIGFGSALLCAQDTYPPLVNKVDMFRNYRLSLVEMADVVRLIRASWSSFISCSKQRRCNSPWTESCPLGRQPLTSPGRDCLSVFRFGPHREGWFRRDLLMTCSGQWARTWLNTEMTLFVPINSGVFKLTMVWPTDDRSKEQVYRFLYPVFLFSKNSNNNPIKWKFKAVRKQNMVCFNRWIHSLTSCIPSGQRMCPHRPNHHHSWGPTLRSFYIFDSL